MSVWRFALLAPMLLFLACRPEGSHWPDPRETTLAEVGPHLHLTAIAYGWEQQIPPVPPRTPEYFYVHLARDAAYWGERGWCPVLPDLEVTLDGEPIPRDSWDIDPTGCDSLIFKLDVRGRLEEYEARETLTVRLSDASGEARYVFDNTLRSPVVQVIAPADGIARRGDMLTIQILPSVESTPGYIDMMQVVYEADMIHYEAEPWDPWRYIEDIAVSETTVQWQVPSNALLGESALFLNDVNAFNVITAGWTGRTFECSGVQSCYTGRLECLSGGGCGPQGSTAGPLDRPTATVTIVE